ncbi:MAG TPA: ribosome small subunit-dependent GTPase A [Bacteroidales bacterium]|nr:ribosome small subunit-dependent GTPase A [Bacteroidales bacterium]
MDKDSNLEYLGYNETFEKLRIEKDLGDFEIGRVIAEHKERYVVKTKTGEFEAEITGNMRFSAKSREDFPATGDWVAMILYDPDFAIIHSILPRSSVISRQAIGKYGEKQIIATNIDFAFLVQAIDRDFNINRLERYLTICYSSKVSPIIVLTKTDLIDNQWLNEIIEKINKRLKNVPVIAISNETREGYDLIRSRIEKGKTYCLLGSSGVGKSTLTNNLAGKALMKTNSISDSTGKGRHVTSHRELIILEDGGILIDNPGLKEVGIADASSGAEIVFDEILKFAEHCRFKDCRHINEIGCAVIEAVENGEIDAKSYENYLKLEKEKEHFESTVSERKKKDKQMGKILKDYQKKDVKGKRG